MHVTEPVHDREGAAIATRQDIAALLQRMAERASAVRLAKSGSNVFAALLRRDTGLFLLGVLGKGSFELVLFELRALLPRLQPVRQLVSVLFGQSHGHVTQFPAIMGHVDRLHLGTVNARPDDMAMLALVLDVKDHGARLTVQSQLVFDGLDGLDILLPRERFRRVDGQAVERFLRFRAAGHRLEFREGAVQIIGDRAPNIEKVIRELDRMIDAICDGVPAERVKDRMIALEAERAEIEERLKAEPKEDKPLLHPSMGGRYRQAIAELRTTLADQSAQHEAVEILRGLIDRIILRPDTNEASGYVMDIEGDLAGILGLCQTSKKAAGLSSDDLMQMKLVAGTGGAVVGAARTACYKQMGRVIRLDEWRREEMSAKELTILGDIAGEANLSCAAP